MLDPLSHKRKGLDKYKLCSTTLYSVVMVLVSLVPRPDFSHLLVNCVWSTIYLFHFRSSGPECWQIVLF